MTTENRKKIDAEIAKLLELIHERENIEELAKRMKL
jgi:hypothetical protein